MGLFAWLNRRRGESDNGTRGWRREWAQVVAAPDQARTRRLRAELAAMSSPNGDLEVEEEMLDGLERLLALTDELALGRLPRVDTTHRVVGTDICHYSTPVSMPDEPAQPGGRLLLTGSRAVFIGGAKVAAIPWHAAGQVLQTDRDLLLVRADAQTAYRFRCNSYADALCAAALARHLTSRTRGRTPV